MERILTALETLSTIDADGYGNLPIEIRFKISKDDYKRIEEFAQEYKFTLYDILEILLVDEFDQSKEILSYYASFGPSKKD